MAKHKVAELEGALLDAAVAKALGYEIDVDGDRVDISGRENSGAPGRWHPSTDWAFGGPIIERERIELSFGVAHPDGSMWWQGIINPHGLPSHDLDGPISPTPLIAAMRCYVASRFGEEVDL